MTLDKVQELLTEHGFTLNCFSPLEITNDDDFSMATGMCAQYVIDCCLKIDEEISKEYEKGDGNCS